MLLENRPAFEHVLRVLFNLSCLYVAVGGVTYDKPTQTVLHTMQYPGRPGRFITVFHTNGDADWSRLRLILYYSRDTTVVWEDGRVISRGVFEPDRRIAVAGSH